MDPAALAILLHKLVPVLALLVFGAVPVAIVWVLKNHKLRMRELEIEEKALLSRGAEARLQALEQRVAELEGGGAPALRPTEQRAALLEGPASSSPTRPETPRLKQR
jgi:hypothetical protein